MPTCSQRSSASGHRRSPTRQRQRRCPWPVQVQHSEADCWFTRRAMLLPCCNPIYDSLLVGVVVCEHPAAVSNQSCHDRPNILLKTARIRWPCDSCLAQGTQLYVPTRPAAIAAATLQCLQNTNSHMCKCISACQLPAVLSLPADSYKATHTPLPPAYSWWVMPTHRHVNV